MTAVITAHAQAPATATTPPTPPLVNSALDADLFYQLLLGELNAQDADPSLGYSLILDAARKTEDPQLFQRAVEIALQARSGESALQAARAWRQALPKSREANRFVLQILIGLNRLGDTVEPMKREVALAPDQDRPASIAALPNYFAKASDKKAAAQAIAQALDVYLSPSKTDAKTAVTAWSTVGRMRLFANDRDAALEAARRGQAIDPQADGPALLALVLMGPAQTQAEAIVQKYLAVKPRVEVRLAYARALLDAQRYSESGVQIQILTQEAPAFAEPWLIQGALALQHKQGDSAEKSLLRYVGLTLASDPKPNTNQERGLVQAYLMLAQLAEQRKDFVQAENWLSKINNEEDLVQTQTRRAGILARQGRLAEARQLMASLPERTPAQARTKLMAQVQLLRDNKLYQAAYDLLAQATLNNPTDFDLLYDQATLAEKLGDTAGMERLLRQIIAGKPDYHHAYNALVIHWPSATSAWTKPANSSSKRLNLHPATPSFRTAWPGSNSKVATRRRLCESCKTPTRPARMPRLPPTWARCC